VKRPDADDGAVMQGEPDDRLLLYVDLETLQKCS